MFKKNKNIFLTILMLSALGFTSGYYFVKSPSENVTFLNSEQKQSIVFIHGR